jgi:hypothetical protein
MDILNMFGSQDNIQDVLSDSNKVKTMLPILSGIAETWKHENEHSICALISFESNNSGEKTPILRVVATKIVNIEINGKPIEHIVISRNVTSPTGEALKFDLLSLLMQHNEQKE